LVGRKGGVAGVSFKACLEKGEKEKEVSSKACLEKGEKEKRMYLLRHV
jgi:hypothetical protein